VCLPLPAAAARTKEAGKVPRLVSATILESWTHGHGGDVEFLVVIKISIGSIWTLLRDRSAPIEIERRTLLEPASMFIGYAAIEHGVADATPPANRTRH
jgi:hypothetical protein